MNRLPTWKRAAILTLLVEGVSMRGASRLSGSSINTVTKLLVDAGGAAWAYHDAHVRDLVVPRVECDEMWSYTYAKAAHVADAVAAPAGAGDIWTWTAIDPVTKLILTWAVGDRSEATGRLFLDDLHARVTCDEIATDAFAAYPGAIEAAFGMEATHLAVEGRVQTQHVERQNLTMRMHVKRLTRQTNAFSRKIANHAHALAVYFYYYNWCRPHTALDGATPAEAAGLVSRSRSLADLVKILESN